jgi:hypothetical protein
MRALTATALAATLVASAATAQTTPTYGCDTPESRRYDFWVGEWELAHSGTKSANHITKALDGCVIVEQFTGAPGTKLDGTSVSTFDRATKRWRQTWVDNTGAYLDFTGGTDNGDPTFEREFVRDGKAIRQRMVFRNITPASLKWLWQSSPDGGKTWSTQWEIDYKRVK